MPGRKCVEFCCGAAWRPLDVPKPSLKVSEPAPVGSGSALHPGFGLGRGEGRTSRALCSDIKHFKMATPEP